MNWIKINLPYDKSDVGFKSTINYPKLNKKANKELGYNKKDLDRLSHSLLTLPSNEREVCDTQEKYRSNYRNYRSLEDYRSYLYCYQAWEEKLPEVITYREEYNRQETEYKLKIKQQSFSGLGLNVPGTLIEVKIDNDIKQFLIGDINPFAGACGDEPAFNGEEVIVIRYKKVWEA